MHANQLLSSKTKNNEPHSLGTHGLVYLALWRKIYCSADPMVERFGGIEKALRDFKVSAEPPFENHRSKECPKIR